MTLTIDVPPEFETRLKEAALRLGVNETEFARQVIAEKLASILPVRDQATLDLLAKWDEEAAAATPEEIALGEKEWEEFKKSMNENSMSGRPIYP